MSVRYDPFDPALRADPYPTYRALRDADGLHWAEPTGAWVVSRFSDVQHVLRSPELFSSDAMQTMLMRPAGDALDPEGLRRLAAFAQSLPFEPAQLLQARSLIASDPPRHSGLRNVVNRGFTPRRIAAWEPRAREIVRSCMAKLAGGGPFDVVRDLAIPLPVTLIAELLGVESERQGDFKHWSDVIVASSSGSLRGADPLESGFAEAMRGVFLYINETFEKRRNEPRDDLVSVVIQAQDGEAGLSAPEVAGLVLLLLVAGNETTTNLIGNATDALLRSPDQLELVRRDKSLVPALVEEALRYDSPVQYVFRRSTRYQELGGTTLRPNDPVVALIGSANRDERQWGPTADAFDVRRNSQGHLGFGHGVHFCLGASLARLEARCALEALIDELPALSRVQPHVEYVDSFLVRGPRALDLVRAA